MKNSTCPEWHWPTDHEYINFWAVGAEIMSPKFPKFGQNSKMAAADRKLDLDHWGLPFYCV